MPDGLRPYCCCEAAPPSPANFLATQYQKTFGKLYCEKSQLDFTVAKEELCNGLSSMLGRPIETTAKIKGGTIAIGTANDAQIAAYISREEALRCATAGLPLWWPTAAGVSCTAPSSSCAS